MLLSQRIAKNPHYIQLMRNVGYTEKTIKAQTAAVKEYRKKIMRATKLIIPNEFMDFFHDNASGRTSTLTTAGRDLAPRHPLFVEYSSRLLMPTLFIENDNLGVLIEERPEGWVASYFICNMNNEGVPCQFFGYRLIFDRTKTFEEWCTELMIVGDGEVSTITPNDIHPRMHAILRNLLTVVSEILLFINTKNSPTRNYTPTAKELKGISKDIQLLYTYKILDIYRDLREVNDLEAVKEFIRTKAVNNGPSRAHLVRGHFKRKKNGLFWWSPFLRNRHNAKDVGIVVKDYNLKIKQ